MRKWTIVCYRQYGIWSATIPFRTRGEAELHADRNLRSRGDGHFRIDKDYIKDVTLVEVELPE